VQSTPVFKAFASLSGDEFMADGEGRFSVMISSERPQGWQGPWLPMEENTTNLLVREYFNDWAKESPSRMVLERLDPAPSKSPPSIESTAEILAEVVEEFDIRLKMWMPWLERTRSFPPNQLASLPHTGQGLKNNAYGEGWFQLEPDEALIIELTDPKADLWSFQLGNQWWESIDYINHTGSLNGHQAVANKDGKYRLIISLQDPGVPNWLDPAGHVKGLIMYRFQNTAATVAVPQMRLVKFDELKSELPKDTIAITKAQRQAEIEMRRAHALRRWAP